MFPNLDQIIYISRQVYHGIERAIDWVRPAPPALDKQLPLPEDHSQSSYSPPSGPSSRPSFTEAVRRNPFDLEIWRETLFSLPPESPCDERAFLEDVLGASLLGLVIGPVAGPLAYSATRPFWQALRHYVQADVGQSICDQEGRPQETVVVYHRSNRAQLSPQDTRITGNGVQASQAMTGSDLVCE